MDQGPLVAEVIDAGAELVRQFDKYQPVKAAFWLKAADDEHRYLYIASDGIDDTNLGAAYREVVRLVHHMRNPNLNLFRVKVIRGNDALACAAADILQRFPAPLPTRIGGGRFGGLTVDDVYIYSAPLPAPVP